MTEEKPESKFKINKGRRTIGALTNNIIEEEWITVEATNRKDCEEIFDKRWKDEK